MTDTILEAEYIQQATDFVVAQGEVDPAVFINGVQYGLNQREVEVQALKDHITELGG